MLSLRDNLILAVTKLRTRPIRLAVTLLVSGLLFSCLFALSFIVRGTIHSLTDFTKEAFLNRFISSIYFQAFDASDYNAYFKNQPIHSTEAINRAKALFAEQLKKQAAEAARLGIPFDPTAETKPYTEGTGKGPDPNQKVTELDLTQPLARQALLELGIKDTSYDDAVKAVDGYQLKGIYKQRSLSTAAGNFSMTPIVSGKEIEEAKTISEGYSGGQTDMLQQFASSVSVQNDALVNPFILKGANQQSSPSGPIPILAPSSAAEKLLGVTELSAKANNQQRLEHIKNLRAKALNYEFAVCYRNSTAIEEQNRAIEQIADTKAHKNDASYTAPSVQYQLASQPCQAPIITKDTRTTEEKATDTKTVAFKQTFGTPKPVVTPLSFRIIGLLPDTSGNGGIDMQSFFTSLLVSSSGNGWLASESAIKGHPIIERLVDDPLSGIGNYNAYLVEFVSRQEQARFMAEKACIQTEQNDFCGKAGSIQTYPYGNPIASLYDGIEHAKAAVIFLLVIVAMISSIIMMGTIGKVVADSRKETSVFRALGARRIQIVQLYTLYASMLGALVVVSALAFGLALALWAEVSFSSSISLAAVLAFNATDLHKQFHLIGWSWPDTSIVAGVIVLVSFLSAAIPLLVNVRRSPVKDMREE